MVFAVKEMKSSVHVPKPRPQRGPGPEFNFHALVQFAGEETSRPSSAFPLPRRLILKPGDDGLGNDVVPPPKPPSEQVQKPPSPIEDYKKELIDFLVWGISTGKARNYMVIFSGHGLGIESDFLTKDSTPPQSLTVKDLRDVLGNGRVKAALKKVGKKTIDILGLDSCLMAMAEVGYELRNEVPLMIASQGSQANLGWPYKTIFASLHDNPKASAEDLSIEIVRNFVAYYDDFSCAADSSADISAFRLRDDKNKHRYMEDVKKAVDSLAVVFLDIIRATDYEKIKWNPAANDFAKSLIFAHWYGQTYHSDQYADISDLCNVLTNNLPHDGPDSGKYEVIRKRCKLVREKVDACIIGTVARRFSGPLYQYSHGLSIYFPWSDIYKLYRADNLDFLKYGNWYEFVEAYIKFTRRPPKETEDIFDRYQGSKDSPPRSKGIDDPSTRAKNPPSLWKSADGKYFCKIKPSLPPDPPE